MSDIRKLTLLHSNDMHGDFLPEEVDGVLTGGISYLSGYVNKVRNEDENAILTISGDMFTGSIIDSEFKGISTIELMNYLAPDVVTIGNHEVDYGITHLLFLEKCAKFPIINSNLFIKSNHSRIFEPYKILNVNGLNIMFIGILTDEVLSQTANEPLVGSFVDIWQAAKEVGVIIDNYKTTNVDMTVLLTHIGYEEDIKLAQILNPNWGIDLIIGGHSHTLLTEPTIVNNIPIVQVGVGTDHLGRFDIEFDKDEGKIVKNNWQLIDINENTVKKDEIMEKLLFEYKAQTDQKYQRIITNFKRPLTHPRRNMETELGNLFADLLQIDSSFDIMILGSGSIRKKELGPIVTFQDLQECMPYDEEAIMLEVTGKQFRHMMSYMLRDEALGDNGHTEFYQLSKGVHMIYNYLTKSFDEFMLNGKEIADEQRIKICMTNGFHYNNFSKFFDLPIEEVIANKKPKIVMTSILSIFEELLSSAHNLDSHIENRIVIKNYSE